MKPAPPHPHQFHDSTLFLSRPPIPDILRAFSPELSKAMRYTYFYTNIRIIYFMITRLIQ